MLCACAGSGSVPILEPRQNDVFSNLLSLFRNTFAKFFALNVCGASRIRRVCPNNHLYSDYRKVQLDWNLLNMAPTCPVGTGSATCKQTVI